MFVISFKNGNDHPRKDSFDEYYMPLVEIKDFNSLFDTKYLFDKLVKNKDEAYGKLVEMSRNNYYTMGTSLDYFYHQKYYNFIGKDL